MNESEIILARYKRVERNADSLGRVIGVRKLKPSEQTKVAGMTAELTGSDAVIGPKGETFMIPHRMPLTVAACVCEIDSIPIPFPRNRGELDAIFDRLDEEGLAAASKGVAALQADNVVTDGMAEAKN